MLLMQPAAASWSISSRDPTIFSRGWGGGRREVDKRERKKGREGVRGNEGRKVLRKAAQK